MIKFQMLNQPCISWDNLYLIMIPLFLFYITGSHLLIILFLALCELQLFSLILPGFFFPRLQENFSYKCTDQSSTEKHVPFLLRIARGFFLCSSLPFGNCYVTPPGAFASSFSTVSSTQPECYTLTVSSG